MGKIRKEEAPIRCLEVKPTHFAIKYIAVMPEFARLLAPLIEQRLDTWDFEERKELV